MSSPLPARTKRDVAAELKVSVATVDRLMASGKLPFFRVGRSVRFKPEDVDALTQTRP